MTVEMMELHISQKYTVIAIFLSSNQFLPFSVVLAVTISVEDPSPTDVLAVM